MTTSIHPLTLMGILSAAGALALCVLACSVRSTLWRCILIPVAVVFTVSAAFLLIGFDPGLVDGRYRTYKAFYRDIRIGMTRDEVFAVLDSDYPAGGARQKPKVVNDAPGQLAFFMNPETQREPNCEGIFLTLTHGRVSGKTYSAD